MPVTSPDDARPDRYARRRRLPRWVTVLLVLLAVALLVVLAAVGLFVWAFSGGWDGLRPGAQPADREVVAARREARGSLDRLTSRTLSAVGGSELARVRFDQCEHGQNNWKIHDGYTLRCELADSVALTPAGGDVTGASAGIDASLRRDGWVPTGLLNEMTEDADANRSHLLATREGTYHRDDDERLLLTVRVTVRTPGPAYGLLPYDPDVQVEGDVDAFRRAVEGPLPRPHDATPGRSPLPRVVVHTTVRYFEDD